MTMMTRCRFYCFGKCKDEHQPDTLFCCTISAFHGKTSEISLDKLIKAVRLPDFDAAVAAADSSSVVISDTIVESLTEYVSIVSRNNLFCFSLRWFYMVSYVCVIVVYLIWRANQLCHGRLRRGKKLWISSKQSKKNP